MTELADIAPGQGNRALLVGQTGSGKTVLAEHLLRLRSYVVVVDWKGRIDWEGYRIVRRAKDLGKMRPRQDRRIVYRPDPEEMIDASHVDRVLRWCYDRERTTVYIDEVYGIIEKGVPLGLRACITRGRELGVEVWAAVQRPVSIPLELVSETEHVYCFRTTFPEDGRRVEEVSGIPRELLPGLPDWNFMVAHKRAVRGPCVLQLPNETV